MADPEITTIKCDEVMEKESQSSASAFSERRPVARLKAREEVQARALAEVFDYVNKTRCPTKACPQMKLAITLGPPKYGGCAKAQVTDTVTGAVTHGSSCTWTCDWTVRIECVEDQIAGLHPTTGPDGAIEPQALDCDDDEELIATGIESGVASNAHIQDAIKAAKALALQKAQAAVRTASLKVHCLKDACPNLQITVLIGPVDALVVPLTTYAIAGCPWAIKVECAK